jgi:hypothetical protein
MVKRNSKFQIENLREKISHTPRIKKAIFRNTTRMPPKNFPRSSCSREMGFDKSKSIFPFSSIIGIKLALENIESNRQIRVMGETNIISSEFTAVNTSDCIPGANIFSIPVRYRIRPTNIIVSIEITKKKIKTFLAKASRREYQVTVIIFFI